MRADLDDDPAALFRRWLDDAAGAGVPEPMAMALATSVLEGRPDRPITMTSCLELFSVP